MNQQSGRPDQILDTQGDYQLSANYGSAEYDALQRRAGLVDLTQERLLSLRGRDVFSFLQGMLTQSMQPFPVGEAKPSLLLDASGKVQAKLNLYHLEDNHLVMECPFELRDTIQKNLSRFVIMEDVTIRPLTDYYFFSLQGKEAPLHREALAKIYPHWHFIDHNRCGFGGTDVLCGREEAGDAVTALIDMGLAPIGFNALNRARIEALIAWFGIDMLAGQNPLVCGVSGIAFNKGCYIGQETVAKTNDRGRPPQVLCLVTGDPDGKVGTLPRPLTLEDKPAGSLTSLMNNPERGVSVGLALVKTNYATPGATLNDATGTFFHVTKTVTHKV
ncbi:CAF17-like 4Fe-4S cluster assembly/insertion protein YgfZ [Acanthopleuribacter pedis]|uniref:GCVT N-terminal domain-containing protein n=1 Tax=Acanthopleuribacter pedis TaxID=442870 RepID=A0A8J7QH19_9BACT|nr:hypothetical protein [Acanthopleuribacter pedis]MBO1320015.1 hypothetical protein [Acanthopleuribacter pedis]